MKENEEQLLQQINVLQTKLDEEKMATILQTKSLNDALNSKSELERVLNAEKEVQSKLYVEITQLKDEVLYISVAPALASYMAGMGN